MNTNRVITHILYFLLLVTVPVITSAATDKGLIKKCEKCHGENGNTEKSSIP